MRHMAASCALHCSIWTGVSSGRVSHEVLELPAYPRCAWQWLLFQEESYIGNGTGSCVRGGWQLPCCFLERFGLQLLVASIAGFLFFRRLLPLSSPFVAASV